MLDLQLSHNQLTEVPIIPPGLEHLHLDHNKIKSKSVSCDVSKTGETTLQLAVESAATALSSKADNYEDHEKTRQLLEVTFS